VFPPVTPESLRSFHAGHQQRTGHERSALELRRARRLQRWADRSAALAARLSRGANVRRARVS
jgi:hypothetical protein